MFTAIIKSLKSPSLCELNISPPIFSVISKGASSLKILQCIFDGETYFFWVFVKCSFPDTSKFKSETKLLILVKCLHDHDGILSWKAMPCCCAWRLEAKEHFSEHAVMQYWAIVTPIPIPSTLWPLNKEWRGQHSQFLRCFIKSCVPGMGWDGGDYGSILHNSMFWEVFLGLQ